MNYDKEDIGEIIAYNIWYNYIYRTRFLWKPSLVWYRLRKSIHWEFGLHKLERTEDTKGKLCMWCRYCGLHIS